MVVLLEVPRVFKTSSFEVLSSFNSKRGFILAGLECRMARAKSILKVVDAEFLTDQLLEV